MTQPDPIHDLEQTLARAARDLHPDAARRLLADVAAVVSYAAQGGDLAEVQTVIDTEGTAAALALIAARAA